MGYECGIWMWEHVSYEFEIHFHMWDTNSWDLFSCEIHVHCEKKDMSQAFRYVYYTHDGSVSVCITVTIHLPINKRPIHVAASPWIHAHPTVWEATALRLGPPSHHTPVPLPKLRYWIHDGHQATMKTYGSVMAISGFTTYQTSSWWISRWGSPKKWSLCYLCQSASLGWPQWSLENVNKHSVLICF